MTALQGMTDILDINETVERLKSENTGNIPDLNACKEVELLIRYRTLLVEVMDKTDLSAFLPPVSP